MRVKDAAKMKTKGHKSLFIFRKPSFDPLDVKIAPSLKLDYAGFLTMVSTAVWNAIFTSLHLVGKFLL